MSAKGSDMKRKGNLYPLVYDIANLRLAAEKACKGKSKQKGVIDFKKDSENYLWKLHYLLRTKTYKTSAYRNFQIKEEKVRDISSLPFFPDRLAHHAIVNILDPIITPTLTSDTYNCIPGRGLLKASLALRKALEDEANTLHCLEVDVKKFYPSVNVEILKTLLRRKIKDADFLWLIDEILDSHVGLPLGNLLSQGLANFYLSPLDHYLKEDCRVTHLFRYCDNIILLHSSKEYLHDMCEKIKIFATTKLDLTIKSNHQVFPVASRMIDFLGYPVNHRRVKLRPRIKKRFVRMLSKSRNKASVASYMGWAKWCHSKHLIKKLLKTCR